MSRISLYIEGQKVDLDNDSFILLNMTMEDLSNPTIVRNSYTQQITLKGTPSNNNLFGHIMRLDRVTLNDPARNDSVYFNPLRRSDFIVFNEMNEILMRGYCRLDDVARNGREVEYKVTLYGGLGSFFYELSTKADGEKMTLADLRFKNLFGNYVSPSSFKFSQDDQDMVWWAWEYLRDPNGYSDQLGAPYYNEWCNIINFAPAYNGLPENFSADKAVCRDAFNNVPNYVRIWKDNTSTQFSYKEGTQSNLMLFSKAHTEWEIGDLRWYLQRPVINVAVLIDAIVHSDAATGWEIVIGSDVTGAVRDLWITLPMLDRNLLADDTAMENVMMQTLSPAEYLLSIAKMLGWVFVVNERQKKMSIVKRTIFYSDGMVSPDSEDEPILMYEDITSRVDRSSMRKIPVLADKRIYQFGGAAIGEWAKSYKDRYGVDYGVKKVLTGNEFSEETSVLTDGVAFKDATDVQEVNLLFSSNNLSRDEAGGTVENFILPKYESVKMQVWGTLYGETGVSMQEVDIVDPYTWNVYPDNPDHPNADWLPKVQLHDSGNKAIDGANVILCYREMKAVPVYNFSRGWMKHIRLTGDTQDMFTLNEQPCWNFTPTNSRRLEYLPSFRKVADEFFAWEWGASRERGTFDNPTIFIYERYWQRYLRERYDKDVYRLTCKVNLRGMTINQNIFSRLYLIDNTPFVLNKITNHSLTTMDDTECEFIRVINPANYIS